MAAPLLKMDAVLSGVTAFGRVRFVASAKVDELTKQLSPNPHPTTKSASSFSGAVNADNVHQTTGVTVILYPSTGAVQLKGTAHANFGQALSAVARALDGTVESEPVVASMLVMARLNANIDLAKIDAVFTNHAKQPDHYRRIIRLDDEPGSGSFMVFATGTVRALGAKNVDAVRRAMSKLARVLSGCAVPPTTVPANFDVTWVDDLPSQKIVRPRTYAPPFPTVNEVAAYVKGKGGMTQTDLVAAFRRRFKPEDNARFNAIVTKATRRDAKTGLVVARSK